MNDILNKSITAVKGIGAVRAGLFNKLDIFNVGDLIFYYPRDYEDRSRIKKIAQLEDGEKCAFIGVIDSKVREKHIRKGLSIYEVSIKDDTGKITAIWYNQHFIKNLYTLKPILLTFIPEGGAGYATFSRSVALNKATLTIPLPLRFAFRTCPYIGMVIFARHIYTSLSSTYHIKREI